jgi:uncharacterized protein YoaH (UPF0181 family)
MRLEVTLKDGGDGMTLYIVENDGTAFMKNDMSRKEMVSLFASWLREMIKNTEKDYLRFESNDGKEEIYVFHKEKSAAHPVDEPNRDKAV